MLQWIIALNIWLPVIYGASALFYGQYFRTKKRKISLWASGCLITGIVCHIVFLTCKGFYFHYFPISNSFESLSILALDIAVIYFIIEKLKKESTTGIFFLIIVFTFQLLSTLFFQEEHEVRELLADPMFTTHAAFTLLGISALAISSLYGLMYWMLAKQIKKRHFGTIYDGLPPLEMLDSMRQYSAIGGVILLGVGIFLGHIVAYRAFENFSLTDPKIIITDIMWLCYAAICFVAWHKKAQDLRTNILAFWIFVLLFLSMVIVNFVSDTFHRFI